MPSVDYLLNILVWDSVLSVIKLQRPLPGSVEFRSFYGLSNWESLAKWLVMILIVILPDNEAAIHSKYFCLHVPI